MHPVSQIHRRRWMRHGWALLIALLLLAACQPVAPQAAPNTDALGPATSVPAATVPAVLIEVNDTEFSIPADFPGGIVAVTVQNNSSQDLDIGFSRLREGQSAEEVVALADDFMNNLVPIMQMIGFMYSFNPIPAGESGTAILDFRTGDFLIDATAHVEAEPEPGAARIIGTFSATELVGTVEPVADVTVEMADFALIMPDTIPAGNQLWQFINTGAQWHMMFLVQPAADADMDAVMQALMAEEEPSGPPPFTFVDHAGVPPIGEGERVWVEYELAPGTYLAACPLPDIAAIMAGEMPMSHIHHGMHRPLTVTGKEASADAAAPPAITITASDFAFELPAEIPAGLTAITFANAGAVNHHGLVVRLHEGVTDAMVMDALAADVEEGATAVLYDLAFFLPDTDPGTSNQVTVDLAPGNWMIISFSMDPTGSDGPPLPDWARGSLQAFSVTEAQGSAPAPTADATITIGDDDFDAPATLAAGKHTLQVVNASAAEDAYAFIVKLGGDTTMEDILAAFEAMFSGREIEEIPLFSSVGGLMGHNLSDTYYTTIDFAPGNYAIITNIDGEEFPYSGLYKPLTVE